MMGAKVEHLVALFFLAGCHPLAFAAEEHRELGAHEHGRGTLNIAVEGNKVTMELEVPGVDIVGFEHAAKTRREKAAVEKAKTQLLAPLTLFALPASAACRVTEAKVEVETGEHDHDAKGAEDARAARAPQRAKGIPSSTPSTRWSARPRAT